MEGVWLIGVVVFLGCVVLPLVLLVVTIQECVHAIRNFLWFRRYRKDHKP